MTKTSVLKALPVVLALIFVPAAVISMLAQTSAAPAAPPQRTVPRPRGPIAGPAQQVAAAETGLRDAVVAADLDSIQKTLADDYSIALPSGELWSKTQLLQALKGGGWSPLAVEVSDMRIKMLGATGGVVSLRARVRRKTGTARNFRIMDVWQKQAEKWQLVASQATALKPD